MKRGFYLVLLLIVLLLTPLSIAEESEENLFLQDFLEIKLDVKGEFTLIPNNGESKVKKVTTELLLYPQNNIRQKVLQESRDYKDGKITYSWSDNKLGTKEYGYSAIVKTKNVRQEVREKIPFPTDFVEDVYKYTEPTETIDSNHPLIIAKATELAEGEDDLFKVVFKLANWVEKTVDYDLNTLTAKASQKASWVLENKNGVCDEMTSLFIAMTRSLGIPARFVKGISYTTSDLFSNKWQPHGWAEVYFPKIGWVSFDVTFGEYGYVDVTHIKLREGLDPREADTRHEWLANDVSLQTKQLDFKIDIQKIGEKSVEPIRLKQEILSNSVDFGSYNLVKGILRNTADYYVATTLQLALPQELKILKRNKRTILLSPLEERETFWIIKVPEDLDKNYFYKFPLIIFSEKNVSFRSEFLAEVEQDFYSLSDIEKLTIQDEEKVYSRQIKFECDHPKEINLDEEFNAKCSIKNTGNTNLKKIEFCLNEECSKASLPINQQVSKKIDIITKIPGRKKLFLTAENGLIEKKTSFEYVVFDPPDISLEFQGIRSIPYDKPMKVNILVNKRSFSVPKNVHVLIKGAGIKNIWKIEELQNDEMISINSEELRLGLSNKFIMTSSWEDEEGNIFNYEQEINVKGSAESFVDKIKLLINTFLNIF